MPFLGGSGHVLSLCWSKGSYPNSAAALSCQFGTGFTEPAVPYIMHTGRRPIVDQGKSLGTVPTGHRPYVDHICHPNTGCCRLRGSASHSAGPPNGYLSVSRDCGPGEGMGDSAAAAVSANYQSLGDRNADDATARCMSDAQEITPRDTCRKKIT